MPQQTNRVGKTSPVAMSGRWSSCWALLALLFAHSALAQTESETTEPAPDPAPQQSTQQQPSPAQLAANDLEVPPTLAPLSVDSDAPNTTELLAPPPSPPPPLHFGGRGQWVLMGSSNHLSVSNATYSNSAASSLYVGGEVGIDYFVVDGVSVGFDAAAAYRDRKGYAVTMLSETTSTSFSGGVRFGINARLSELVSWYPRLTLMLESSHGKTTPLSSSNGAPLTQPVSSASVGPAINFFAPLLLHPASHFVFGFGPRLQHDFAVIRGGSYDGAQSTWVSGEFVVGGWWGGASAEEREVAIVTAVAKPEKSADAAFGKPGQLVLTTATDAWVGHRSYSNSKGSETDVTFEPSIDYFIANGVSLGGEISIGYSSGTGPDASGTDTQFSSTNFGGGVHAGYNVELSVLASIWLRAGAGYGSSDVSVSSADGTNQHTSTGGWVDLSAPFLLHPVSHFFFGAGPFLFHELDKRDQNNKEYAATRLGVSLLLGGWFGGPKLAW